VLQFQAQPAYRPTPWTDCERFRTFRCNGVAGSGDVSVGLGPTCSPNVVPAVTTPHDPRRAHPEEGRDLADREEMSGLLRLEPHEVDVEGLPSSSLVVASYESVVLRVVDQRVGRTWGVHVPKLDDVAPGIA
jgi:hypothetical protein